MTTPSPICTVKDGSGSPQSTTNGVDVTAANTITVALQSVAGVAVWDLAIVGQDEEVAAPTLTVDSVAKSATFTAPAAPWSLMFRSMVNRGVDINGATKASYTTTLKVACAATDGARLLATNETTENNAATGWTGIVNARVRSSGGSAIIAPVAPPLASAFTFQNQTGGTTKTTNADGVLQIDSPSFGAGNSRSIATVAQAAAPYSRRVGILASMQVVTDLMLVGICISDGTKAIGVTVYGGVGTDTKVAINHFTNLTTPGAAIVNVSVGSFFSLSGPLFFGLDETGGNRIYSLSNSGREGSYQTILSEAVGFLTPDRFGLMWQGFSADPATHVKFDVFHWASL